MRTLRTVLFVLIATAITAGVAACATTASSVSEGDPTESEPESDASEARQVTILYVADLHAQIEPHPELFWSDDGEDRLEIAGGFARVTEAINQIREERGGDVIVLDGGDTIQGSGVGALSEGEALVPVLNAMGFDAMLPGNWEVGYGPDVLRERMAQLDYSVFVANLRDEASGERLFPPYHIQDVAGVRIAVVGYTDPDVPERQPPAYSKGLSYDDAEELPALIEEVRRDHDADVVLLLSHIGLAKAVALTDLVPDIDVHLSSDTHERTYEPLTQAGTWVVEPGAFGSFLGRLDLWVQDGEVVDKSWELIELTADAFDEDPEIRALIDEATAPYKEELGEIVGHSSSVLARHNVIETTLDHLLADALRDVTGTEIALSNGFRFGNPLPPGPIRESDLWNFYPVVTQLKTGKVTGAQIHAFWERELENVFATDATQRFGGWIPRPSGMTITFEAKAPAGERVREILVHGEPLEHDRLYTLTACEREGEHPDTLCRIPNARDTEIVEVDAHEAVRLYLQQHEEVGRDYEGRVIGLDLPRILRSQM